MRAGSLLLADCAQGAGKIALPDADFIAVSAHKFGGPPGIGALLIKDLARLEASGGQERGYRRGTENLPAAAGMAAALHARTFANAMPRLAELRRTLEEEIEAAGGVVIAKDAPRSPAIGAYAMPGVASASQLVQLDLAGILRFRRKRLLFGQHEAEPGARGDGRSRRNCGMHDSSQLRAGNERDRHRALPRRVARHREPCQGPRRMIYLDYQATTPIAPEVADAMKPWIVDRFANPHSPSRWGREADAAIEVARRQVENAIGLDGGSVAFTGSATEAINWALKGTVENAPRAQPHRHGRDRACGGARHLRVAGRARRRPHRFAGQA